MGATEIKDLPRWAWLWLPLSFAAVLLVARLLDGGQGFYFRWFEGENGVVESGTFVVLVPTVVFALLSYRARPIIPGDWLGRWLLLFALGCLYFGGEEVSWGQHWFGWESPGFFERTNLQGETNLHNLGLRSDRIPKFLVALAVFVGGLAMPLWRRFRGLVWTPDHGWRYWILPTKVGMCAAALAIAVRLVERVKTWFDLEALPLFDMMLKEVHEFYLALFLALYAWSLYLRVRAYQRPA